MLILMMMMTMLSFLKANLLWCGQRVSATINLLPKRGAQDILAVASPSSEPMNITLLDDADHDVIFTMLDVHLKFFFWKRCNSEVQSLNSRAQELKTPSLW